ncbi:hypothetical protein, variant [Saprolegnia diclina VS20]|uniref:Uncharacterized protein n=1 Tax=Saprolegnia diclina (strain VS20) TaxID=1156394 RepID=T0RLW3_SAPDV|nr:hypothetical protein, variant [Saprolegnia diclina VS20]EQC33333.1 hypothetical protein, variant [Saprolegnia diclina VS20]|eukprot:XP_008613456.1 hypothetical protein, variant [Saprolegnia diclina VS20]
MLEAMVTHPLAPTLLRLPKKGAPVTSNMRRPPATPPRTPMAATAVAATILDKYRLRVEKRPSCVHLSRYAQLLLVAGNVADARGVFRASMEACAHHTDIGHAFQLDLVPCLRTLAAYAFFLEHYEDDDEMACALYERVLAVDPTQALAMGNYAMLLHKMSLESPLRIDQAYEAAIERYPRHGTVLCKYAGWLVQQRRLALAEQMYLEAIDAAPASPDVVGNYAAFLHSIKHDDDAAEVQYERAVALQPTHAVNCAQFASFLALARHDVERAQTFYKRSLAANPNDSDTWHRYGQLFWRDLHLFHEARECFCMALQLDKSHVVAALDAARVSDADLNDAVKADEFYQRAIELDGGATDALSAYGDFLQRHERMLEAEVMLEKAYASDKDNMTLIERLCHVKCLNMARPSYDVHHRRVDEHVLENLFQHILRLSALNVHAVTSCAVAIGRVLDCSPTVLYEAAATDPALTVNALVARGMYAEVVDGCDDEAESFYRHALDHDDLSFEAIFAFSKFLVRAKNDKNGAIRIVRNAIAACQEAHARLTISDDVLGRKQKQMEKLLQAIAT